MRPRDQAQNEVSALLGGQRSVDIAREGRLNREEGARQFDKQLSESKRKTDLQHWEQAWERNRAERERRDYERGANQAQKGRTTNFGSEGYLPGRESKPIKSGDPRLDAQLEEQSRQFDIGSAQQQQQFDTRTELDAISKGFNYSPDGGQRMQQLLAEMQRGEAQMGQGIEHIGGAQSVRQRSSEHFTETRGSAESRSHQAQTERMNAVARQQEAALRFQALAVRAAGAVGGSKAEFEKKMEPLRKELMAPVNKSVNLVKNLSQNKASEADWRGLEEEVSRNPSAGAMAEIQQEISAREFGPATRRFLAEKVATDAIKFATYTGEMPKGIPIDPSTEGMQRFKTNTKFAAAFLKTPINAALYPITDEAEWVRMVTQLGAFLTMAQRGGPGMPQMPGAGGLGAESAGGGGAMPQGATPMPRQVSRQGMNAQGQPVTGSVNTLNPRHPSAKPTPPYEKEDSSRRLYDQIPTGLWTQ